MSLSAAVAAKERAKGERGWGWQFKQARLELIMHTYIHRSALNITSRCNQECKTSAEKFAQIKNILNTSSSKMTITYESETCDGNAKLYIQLYTHIYILQELPRVELAELLL